MSRKGPAVRATVRVPKVFPPKGSDVGTIQQELDEALGEKGEDLVFQVHFGTKATVLLVAIITQLVYAYGDVVLQSLRSVNEIP